MDTSMTKLAADIVDLLSPYLWQTSFSQSAPAVQTHLLKQALWLSKYHSDVNKARGRTVFQKLKFCFTSTETVGLLGTGAQDVHLDFHTAPELCVFESNDRAP